MNTVTAPPTDGHNHSPVDHEIDHEMERAARARLKMGWGQRAVVAILLTVVLVPPLAAFYSYFSGIPLHLLASTQGRQRRRRRRSVPSSISLVSGPAHTVEVSDEVAATLGVRKGDQDSVAVAQPPTMMRPLVLPGSTAFDPSRLCPHPRSIRSGPMWSRSPRSMVHDRKDGQTQFRELRQGDAVAEGDLLGVFYSVDVGSKKNDLLQALVQLELDQKILDKFEDNQFAVPKVTYLTQKRAVQGDRTEINRALNNLKVVGHPPGRDRRASCRGQEDQCRQECMVPDPGGPVGQRRETWRKDRQV